MTEVKFVSRYEQRIKFVQETVKKHTKLGETAAHDLAVHVVYAIDHIPESTR